MPISAISAAGRSGSPGSCVVLPALPLNYLGQGALLLADPEAIENPFFLLYPHWALLPMVVLATAATVIASQAVITGAYLADPPGDPARPVAAPARSATPPRRRPGRSTCRASTRLLLVGVLLLVALFRSSSALASAYGIAVTGTMVVTAMMAFIVIWKMLAGGRSGPQRPDRRRSCSSTLTFLAANLLKVFDGGWVPLLIGGLVMIIMLHLAQRQRASSPHKTRRLETAARSARSRVAGEEAAAAGAGHGCVPHQPIRKARRPRCCTA